MRLAAVYTLRKLVDEFPEDNDMVVALLSEHLRENQRRWDDEQALPADISEITKLIVGATQDYDR